MLANELILVLFVGGLLGMVGQGIRTIVGLKKVYDQSVRQATAFTELFQGSQISLSLLIGFVAGVLGVISFFDPASTKFTKETLLTLIGIGYAGSDFIEGFIKKYLPPVSVAGVSGASGVPDPANTRGDNEPAVG